MSDPYFVIQDACILEGQAYTGYGIAVRDPASGATAAYPDVSTDLAPVKRLVELCNTLELDPIHLPDVIEDFLVQP